MIASLAMYDWPALRSAHGVFYRAWRDAIRSRGVDAPAELAWERPLAEIWRSSELLLAQTCGFPFVTGLCADAQLLATPCYDADGCEGPAYRSILVAHKGRAGASLTSFFAGTPAVNSLDSHSGYNAFRGHLAERSSPASFFEGAILTGSHLASMRAVAEGRADIAAIDCVMWAHLASFLPELRAELTEIERTALAPGLPFITAGARSPDEVLALRDALAEVLRAPSLTECRKTLKLRGAEPLSRADYQQIRELSVRA